MRRGAEEPTFSAVTAEGAPSPRRRRPLRVLLACGLVVGGLSLGGALAFGPIVRGKVDDAAHARNLDVTVGTVRPGWFSVTLRDVRARPRGVDGVEARLSEVRVGLTASLRPSSVSVRGGAVEVDAEPDRLVEQLRAFRVSGRSESRGDAHAHLPIELGELSLNAHLGGDVASATSLRVARTTDGSVSVDAAALELAHAPHSVRLAGAHLELSPDGKPRVLDAERATITASMPKRDAAPRGVGTVPEPTPPPLPPVTRKRRGKRGEAHAASAAAQTAPSGARLVPLPDPKKLRARVRALASTALSQLPEGLRVSVRGLDAKLDVEGEPIALGPGPLVVERRADRVTLSFSTDATPAGSGGGGKASTPLSLDGDIPLGDGDVTLRLSGGPVSLALLGVKEGQRGLLDVARGTLAGKGQVTLSGDGDALTFDGRVSVAGLSVSNPRLALEPIRGLDLAVSGRGVVDAAGKLRLEEAGLDMGALHLQTHGQVEETDDRLALSLAFEVAPAACQALLDSAPAALVPTVKPARMSGTFSARGRVAFDTTQIGKLELDYDVGDACRMTEVPVALSRDRFARAFTYRAYHPDGTPYEVTTGPGTNAWTDLDAVSPHVVGALLTTEDGAFFRHKGFNHAAIKSSVLANLRARRFVRGASTITMQLAKNLFLSRQKTLSRKIEEVILTDYLEQVFRKDDILELYVNVVEFGPDLYGVTRAAEHYFGRKPEELNVGESFFLASILPSPVRYSRMRDAGQLSERWTKHLHALFEIAAKNGKITPTEATEAIATPVVFLRPGDARPEPRAAVKGQRPDPYGADDAWQPVD